MEFFKKEIKTSTGLIVIFAAAVLFVGGALTYWYYNDPNNYASSPDSTVVVTTNSNTNSASETADWKTYTNTKYGYSFKYPSLTKLTSSAGNANNLVISPTADGVNVALSNSAAGDYLVTVSIPNIVLTEAAIKQQFGATKSENITVSAMVIGGQNGYKTIISDEGVVSSFYFVKNLAGNVLEITVLNNNSDAAAMLSTFQFTTATADWKVFTNTAYGYSMKYPTGWSPTSIGDITTESGVSIANSTVNYGLGVEVIQSQLSLDNYITSLKTEAANYIKNGQPGDTFGTESQVTIGDQTATKIINCTQSASAYKYDWYFIKKDSNIYKISVTKVVGEGIVFDASSYISIAETMLSTFQFTK